MNIEVTQFRAAILGTQLRSLERSGYADEPVADGLPVEGLVGHGGLVGEHGQNRGQVAAHLQLKQIRHYFSFILSF